MFFVAVANLVMGVVKSCTRMKTLPTETPPMTKT